MTKGTVMIRVWMLCLAVLAESDIQRLEVRRFSWLKSGIATLVVGVLAHTMVDRFAPVASNRSR